MLCNIVSSSFTIFISDKILINGTRNYKITEIHPSNLGVTSVLRIKRFRRKDAGQYECVVKNSIGQNTETIRLYRKPLNLSTFGYCFRIWNIVRNVYYVVYFLH